MNINLEPYRLLIIDDFAQFRLTLKKMLERKGAVHVDQVGNAGDALKACRETRYDIMFCDYNLGGGQDGQQLLEEMHQRSLLPKGCLFVMVTAEMMAAQVIGALEYQPDAYLGKPFSFEQFSLRVDRLVARNQALRAIYRALEAGDIERALASCDEVGATTPATRYACLRIKAEIYEQQQEFAAARDIYQSVAGEQPLLWAMLGIGRLLYLDDRVDEALAHFQQLRESQPRQISVIDWIARCHQRLGDMERSERALLEAVALSPKSVIRQARLGDIAEQLEHHDVARQAWARTINEGQHSCLVGGDNYRRYFDSTGKLLGGFDERERSRAIAESELAAKRMETRFRHQPTELALNHCALADLFGVAGRAELSSRFVDKLAQALEHSDCRLSEQHLAYVEGKLQGLGNGAGDERARARIDQRLQALEQAAGEHRRQDEIARDINQQGLLLYEQNDAARALEKFRQALDVMPENPTYLLNAVQTVLLDSAMRADSELLREARGWMRRVSLGHDDERLPLYRMLQARLPHG